MEQIPSCEANWFAASQEIPLVLWNPKVPHRTHKRPPRITILSQPNPVLTPTSHFLKIRPNIIVPSTPRSPQRSLSVRFPHQKPVHTSPFPIRATCPAHLIVLTAFTETNFIPYINWETASDFLTGGVCQNNSGPRLICSLAARSWIWCHLAPETHEVLLNRPPLPMLVQHVHRYSARLNRTAARKAKFTLPSQK
jgi:hypothetical protein